MHKINNQKTHPIISLGIVLFAFVYMFFYQLAYSFNPAIFLYVIFALCLFLIVAKGKILLDGQILLMFLLVVLSVGGVLYTSNVEEGSREAILLAVLFVFMITTKNNEYLSNKLDRAVDIGAILVLIGVFSQFILQDGFNTLMKSILRDDCHEQLMKSFETDSAYAGFSAYTVDAAFFLAIVFGNYSMRLVGLTKQKKRHYIFNLLMAGLSLYGVFLTSKRGILIGMIVAFFFTMLIMRKISSHMARKIIISTVMIVAAIVVFYNTNEAARTFLNRFMVDSDMSTGRLDMYKLALEKLLSGNFMFGFGTGATYDLYSAGLHNIYLQILYDHGFLGLAPYLIFFIFDLVKAYRANNARSMYIQSMMLIYGMFGNPIYSNMIFMTYLIQVAGLNGSNSPKNNVAVVER